MYCVWSRDVCIVCMEQGCMYCVYGAGMYVLCVWSRDVSIVCGVLEVTLPKVSSLPA